MKTAGLDRDEVSVFQSRGDRGEALRRASVGLVESDTVLTFNEVSLRDATLGFPEQPIVRLGRDLPLVDRPLDSTAGQVGCRLGDQAAIPDHGEAGAKRGHILDDMSGQDDDPILGELRKQPVEPQAFLGIEPGRRLVDDDQPRIAGDRLGDP